MLPNARDTVQLGLLLSAACFGLWHGHIAGLVFCGFCSVMVALLRMMAR